MVMNCAEADAENRLKTGSDRVRTEDDLRDDMVTMGDRVRDDEDDDDNDDDDDNEEEGNEEKAKKDEEEKEEVEKDVGCADRTMQVNEEDALDRSRSDAS